MGITSFAPERHVRMYANTIPENLSAVKGLESASLRPFEKLLDAES
jgi:hypothetical protein